MNGLYLRTGGANMFLSTNNISKFLSTPTLNNSFNQPKPTVILHAVNHKNRTIYHYGYSLIELIITSAIIAILSSMSFPSLKSMVEKSRSDALEGALRSAIALTRSTAISNKTIVSLCPYGASGCGEHWSKTIMIFTDANNNHIIDDNDKLLEKIDLPHTNLHVGWRASGGRNYLRYSPTGMAREFGRFTICSEQKDLTLARSIVINRQGRARRYKDRDHNGIVEDIDGRLPDCPS